MSKRNCYILFSDIKNFSKLSEDEFELFSKDFIQLIYKRLNDKIVNALTWNTWGDAIFIASEDPNFITSFAFMYRDLFDEFNFKEKIGRKLLPRIACHFGEVTLIDDDTLGKKNLFGINVNTAARLEPSTRPGEIFVTRNFFENYSNSPSSDKHIKFDPVGKIICAKAFGEIDTFRMRKESEPEQAIDWLGTLDLSSVLPEPPSMVQEARQILQGLSKLPRPSIKAALDAIATSSNYIGDTLLVIADMYKNCAFYEDALRTLDKLENFEMDVDGIKVYPYRYRLDAQKIKANSLTRLGRFEDAINIVYGLWSAGYKDSDTLSMLAAQYKRRAIYGENDEIKNIDVGKIDLELIERSRRLYLEAFRLNLEDYYPAINAAYLFKMFGGINAGAGGTKLALYIKEAWKDSLGQNWWIDSTLAEAEILLDDYSCAFEKFSNAIETHSPNNFELMATKEQISIFAHIMHRQNELTKVIEILDNEPNKEQDRCQCDLIPKK